MFALVDCNAFYASCEQIFRPDLRGRPVVVLSNNDGCIVSCSREAKQLGFAGFAPYFRERQRLARHGVQVFSSNYELYGDISRRVMQLLDGQADAMEVYSIDEAFLQLDGLADYRAHGEQIRRLCWQQQRMPVCVGIAPSKTLAKLANHIAKQSQKLQGVCVLQQPAQWAAVLRRIAVDKVWGVGSRLAARLSAWQIHTAEDLRRQNPQQIRRDFGRPLELAVRELNGEPCLGLETQPQPKQQIFCSRSFSRTIDQPDELAEAVACYAVRAAEKLRAQHGVASRVYVMVQTSRYATPGYYNSASQPLPFASDDSRNIVAVAVQLCRQLYRQGYRFNKAGVGLLELASRHGQQATLFGDSQSLPSQAMMQAVDAINRRYGRDAVFLARQGSGQSWAMARGMKSPAYTTRVCDIPVIHL
ncbi:MAG TPA: Y-family DNA polymerase [Pseudomonadales bacterium]